ncbi:MAG: hypothetical protein IH914_00150 [candidate division Zixibacteria bacterium]|nr:hypothetical protein [candidate division Zixibacteria bacterium]
MELKELLVFVVALWAVYLVVLSKSFGTPLSIKRNILKSWTGSQLPAETKDIRGIQYIAFGLESYKKVPWILRSVRLEYTSYKWILGLGLISFLVFLGLGVFTAYVSWQTIGSDQAEIPNVRAQILVTGHIVVLILNVGLLSIYRYFESRFAHHIYIIDENGERIRKEAEE